MKPELVHYGGNCDGNGHYIQAGVISVDGTGHLAEDIGTSFACPLVSGLTANVERELDSGTERVPPVLVKAVLVHSAFLRSAPLDAEVINYLGTGCPPDLADVLNCRQGCATVIFRVPVQPGVVFEKRPFPMPGCLMEPGGGLRGEVYMTLLYDPPLDLQYGIEYCRTNITASLGTLASDPATGKEVYTGRVEAVPKRMTSKYEEALVRNGFKWSPLKLYHHTFARGPVGVEWRLTLELLDRHDWKSQEPQDVVLIVTVRSRLVGKLVYDELVQGMNRLSWDTQSLQLRSRARVRR